MPRFVVQVPLRWTDQDSYQHVNHARAVTLLEEARIGLFFARAAADGVDGFTGGLLVAALGMEYKRQIPWGPHPLRVAMWIDEVRAASFRISYEMRTGPAESYPVAVTAWTRMATFDLGAQRPRRLLADERAFLARWVA